MLDSMFPLLFSLLRLLVVPPGSVREIALENLALRQQLAVFKRQCPRPRLRSTDRLFWVWLSRTWKDWRRVLVMVRPETVVSWHRKGFCLFWAGISRKRRTGRPEASREIRALIRKMATANPFLGSAPHPRRAAQAGHPHLRTNRVSTSTQKSQTSFSNLEGIPRQSRERVGLHRFLHGANRDLSGLVRFGSLGPSSAQGGSFQRDRASDGSLDRSANLGSVPRRHCATLLDPRPGPDLR